MSKKSEVVTRAEETTVAVVGESLGEWGVSDFGASDIVIPRILLMQGTSKLAQDGTAKIGDIVDSMSGTVIGDEKKPIEIIPFHMEKAWTISKKVNGEYKYERRDAWTAANDNQEWEQTINGHTFKFEKTYDFYVLLKGDLSLPYILSCKSTGVRAAKELSTQMYVKNKMSGLVPPAKVISVSVEKIQKDTKKYCVYKTSVAGNSTKEEIAAAFTWYKTISSGKFKTHEVKEEVTSSEVIDSDF